MAQHCPICQHQCLSRSSKGILPSYFPPKTLYPFVPAYYSSVGEIILQIMLIANNMLAAAVVLICLVSSKTICMLIMSLEESSRMYQ
jgi:hypothetical protein